MPTDTFFNLPEDKRRIILDRAIEEFADHNYNQASVSRIVARAGIAKGSLYQYFTDKRDLYLYLLQLVADEKQTFLAAAQPPDPNGSIFDTLRWLFSHGMNFEFSNPRLAQIGYRAIYGDAPLPDETKALLHDNSGRFFRPLIEQGMANGDIDPELDPELAAFLFNAVFTQLGDYMLERLGVSAAELAAGNSRQLDQPEYWALIEDLLAILERALSPQPVH
ncbi:MAG: TetR/AcrR family transcriptional regulator [Chloroflexota bacterium]|jgi:TetR/AcrR family transcriptional regulator